MVLDTDWPAGTDAALALVGELAATQRVVALGLSDARSATVEAVAAGAASYVRKHDPVECLFAAIREAAALPRPRTEAQ